MKVLVTGASGFLGRHLMERLGQEHNVLGLCRTPAEGLLAGDILEPESLRPAMEGVEVVVHAAGAVSHDPSDAEWMEQVHVRGSRNVLAAAEAAGARRLILISSSGTIAVSRERGAVLTEDSPDPMALIRHWPYYRAKHVAESRLLDAVRPDFDVISLNPSLLLGPGDPTGVSVKSVSLLLAGEIPAAPPGVLSFVDVRDVADAVVRAIHQGESGERYLLSSANLSFGTFFSQLAELGDVAAPSWALPPFTLGLLRLVPPGLRTRLAGLFGVDRIELEMSCHCWAVDASKATEQLGWSPRDPTETLRDTVRDLVMQKERL